MYGYSIMPDLIKTTEAAITQPVSRFGISVYVECDPDTVNPDIYIDPLDEKGISIFREFAAKMAAHYKTLI